MGHRKAAEGRRILICAPFGRDAESLQGVLAAAGYDASAHSNLASLTASLDNVSGAVLLTEEALVSGVDDLRIWLAGQPSWLDLPVILLSRRQAAAGRAIAQTLLAEVVSNLTVLERPIGTPSLLSAIDGALIGRQRQFETGRHLAELRESREALAASERELRTVTDALPMLIGFIGADHRYHFANRAYRDWLGRSPAEMIGRDVFEVMRNGDEHLDIKPRRAGIDRALAGEDVVFQAPWPHLDGSRRDAEVRYLPRRDNAGVVDGFYVFVQDVTDRAKAEEILREAASELESRVAERTSALETEMAGRAEAEAALRQSQKMEAVGQLTGGIAHDFNNMLTGVLGSLAIIRKRISEGRTADLDRFIDAAQTSAERAAALTQRLLAFSRRQSLHAQPTDLVQLVTSMEGLLSQALTEDISLHLQLPKTPVIAAIDPSQLENALLNLVINARDAMPDGGTLTVHVAAAPAGPDEDDPVLAAAHACLSVRDTGVGMPAEIVEKVFDPFFTTKPIGQGTGLGLSMVYGFAQQSGGTVRIDSAPGAGTTIALHLPLADGDDARAMPLVAAALAEGGGRRVLFVEDDPGVRLLVSEVLSELGFEAVEAADPAYAVEVLGSGTPLDLMITDVGLPGMNGRQLADIARAARPDLPILFVTGYAENATIRADFLSANMAMITKPFTIEILSGRISEVLSSDKLQGS